MQYNFEWDPEKAKTNWQKHKVRFEQAATVFRDPLAISIYDIKHSDYEDRWITSGISSTGNVLVIHHTFNEIDVSNANIRIFSSRKATKREKQQYLEENK
ncbi:MAG: BrnT family toxin [Candidatus Anammoxibacter sp.]